VIEESVYSAVVNRIVAEQNTVCNLCSCYAATHVRHIHASRHPIQHALHIMLRTSIKLCQDTPVILSPHPTCLT